jgi:uncharacterized protein (TIGR00369 family)
MSSSSDDTSRPDDFTRCFGCGQDNHRGLRMVFRLEGDEVVSEWTPATEFGGYGRVLHGGITATILDEAFGWALYRMRDQFGLTLDMSVRYLGMLRVGKLLTVRARIVEEDEKTAVMEAEIRDHEGRLAASGRGSMRFISRRLASRLM